MSGNDGEGDGKKKRVNIAFKLVSEQDYQRLKSDRQISEERERNLQMLLKLRP